MTSPSVAGSFEVDAATDTVPSSGATAAHQPTRASGITSQTGSTSEAKTDLPLHGCEIAFSGGFGRRYPRDLLFKMLKKLGAKTDSYQSGLCMDDGYTPVPPTHVIASRAAYNQGFGTVCMAEKWRHDSCCIVRLEWLVDCYDRMERLDEDGYYFKEPPKVMCKPRIQPRHGFGPFWRPYEHLVQKVAGVEEREQERAGEDQDEDDEEQEQEEDEHEEEEKEEGKEEDDGDEDEEE